MPRTVRSRPTGSDHCRRFGQAKAPPAQESRRGTQRFVASSSPKKGQWRSGDGLPPKISESYGSVQSTLPVGNMAMARKYRDGYGANRAEDRKLRFLNMLDALGPDTTQARMPMPHDISTLYLL